MLKLQNDVWVMRKKESDVWRTIPSQDKLLDSQSMGGVEAVIRWWRAQFVTLRLWMQDK